MASVLDHKRAAKRLRALGVGGYVVLTPDAAKAGLTTNFPIGVIVGFSDSGRGVRVRKVGQTSASSFAAGFWQPAPNRLINHLVQP